MIYITIHDDSLEGTLKDMTVRVEDDGDRATVSRRVQEKANELFTSWNTQKDKVMPDD
nr:MAG TPA: hypothetical protein [Caudoviricetes sp.]